MNIMKGAVKYKVDSVTEIGDITPEIPRTRDMFEMFEPIRLPIVMIIIIPLAFCRKAATEEADLTK